MENNLWTYVGTKKIFVSKSVSVGDIAYGYGWGKTLIDWLVFEFECNYNWGLDYGAIANEISAKFANWD